MVKFYILFWDNVKKFRKKYGVCFKEYFYIKGKRRYQIEVI